MTTEEFKAKYPLTYGIILNMVEATKSPQGEIARVINDAVRDFSPEQLARIEAAAADAGPSLVAQLIQEELAK